jgi:hypothetical protein
MERASNARWGPALMANNVLKLFSIQSAVILIRSLMGELVRVFRTII